MSVVDTLAFQPANAFAMYFVIVILLNISRFTNVQKNDDENIYSHRKSVRARQIDRQRESLLKFPLGK